MDRLLWWVQKGMYQGRQGQQGRDRHQRRERGGRRRRGTDEIGRRAWDRPPVSVGQLDNKMIGPTGRGEGNERKATTSQRVAWIRNGDVLSSLVYQCGSV
jgi:hypothetical protein